MSAQILAGLVRTYRLSVRLDADPSLAEPHSSGGLVTWGTARTIGVLDYPEFSPPVSELCDEAALFDPVSMQTAIGVPLTIDHPPIEVDSGLVTPDTYRSLTHGCITEVARRDNDFRVRVVMASRESLDAYASGIRELSMAYQSRFIPEPGEFNGRPYQGRQSSIVYNAIAMVPAARAGHTARLDAAPGHTMKKLKIGKLTRDVPAFVADTLTAQADAHKTAIAALDKTRRDAIETGEVVIDGATLVLPKVQIDAILAMLSGGASASEPAAEATVDASTDPTTPPPAQPAPEDKPRMDAKTIQAQIDAGIAAGLAKLNVPALVSGQVTARLDAAAHLERTRRVAAPMLGEGYDFSGKDEHQLAADVLVRLDAKSKDDVERLAKAAREGDARAAGRLEQRLEDASRSHLDSSSTSAGNLALAIDDARAQQVRADAANANAPKPVNKIAEARQRRADRLAGKTTASA